MEPGDINNLFVGVCDNKYDHGVDDLADGAYPLTNAPYLQAMAQAWPTDAHFVAYRPIGTGQQLYPRLNKPILPKLRHHGANIVSRLMVFDFDTPEHQPWTQDSINTFWAVLANVAKLWPMSDRWNLLYTTRKGARLIYLLSYDIPVDVAETKHRWMVQQFHNSGLPVDKLSDWTRLFRLPFVKRDGKNSWTDPHIHIISRHHNVIDPEELGSMTATQTSDYGAIRHFDDPMPSEDECDDLLNPINPQTGRRSASAFIKEAKKRLENRECYPCLFEHQPINTGDGRNNTIHKYVGQAIAMLYYWKGCTPAHIYALFLDPVKQLEPDKDTPDWKVVLWDHVGRIWVKEEAKKRQTEEEATKLAEESLSTIDRIVAGMRQWCTDENLRKDEHTARLYAEAHLIVSVDDRYFVMREDGKYDSLQVSRNELIPRIKALRMDNVIEVRKLAKDGLSWASVMPQEIVNKHATLAGSILGMPQIGGGYLTNPDSASARMVVQTYMRNPYLTPEFNADVDTWLELIGGPRYIELCEWIAWAIAFEEGPICALSLVAPPGIGKKMFVMGLAETLIIPKVATGAELIGTNQYALLNTPYVHVDEGWPQNVRQQVHPADAFRAYVSGQSFDCNRKFKAPVEVKNPPRIILTANNNNIVNTLTAGRELSPEDREALAVRLKHMAVSDDAATWLRQRGGLSFTSQPGNRWIAGDGKEPSNYVVARHFLWLWQNRQRPQAPIGEGLRFLVEGNAGDEIMMEMRTSTGSTPLVIECVIKMLNLMQRLEGLCIQDDRLFVLTSSVLEYYRNHMTQASKERLTAHIISNVFKGLIIMEHPDAMTLRERPEVPRRRWYELDPEMILRVSRRDGWNCPRLEALVAARRIRYGIQSVE